MDAIMSAILSQNHWSRKEKQAFTEEWQSELGDLPERREGIARQVLSLVILEIMLPLACGGIEKGGVVVL